MQDFSVKIPVYLARHPPSVRRGVRRDETHAAQQLARGEPKFTAAKPLHVAPPSGRALPRPAALFPEPPPLRVQLPGRVPGKCPRDLMTGQTHAHWLTLLGLGELQPRQG